MAALKKTQLNKVHRDLKARMMDFAGWKLLTWYISILEEHTLKGSPVPSYSAVSHTAATAAKRWLVNMPRAGSSLTTSVEH